MIKLMVFVKKRSDMTREQFKEYWVNKHSELERQVFARGRIKKITATFIGATLVGESSWDGFVELYFDSHKDLEAALQDDDEMMKKDEANFCDLEHRIVVMTEEVVIAGVSPPPFPVAGQSTQALSGSVSHGAPIARNSAARAAVSADGG